MTEAAPLETAPQPARRWPAWLIAAALVVLAVRLVMCALMLNGTGDLFRHLYYGGLVWREGLGVAGYPLAALDYDFTFPIWPEFAYNYPIVTLAFFTLIAGVWPTLLACKLALTLLEGLNALMLARLTGERWIGLLYWACPISIWWVSREGQFEPLQNAFVLLALLLLARRPLWAIAILGLAVQVKLTALALVPWVFGQALKRGHARAVPLAGAFCLGFLPMALASLSYPALKQPLFGSALLKYNPYYWLFTEYGIFTWNPRWMVHYHAFVSFLALFGLLVCLVRSRDRLAYLAPLLLVVFIKFSSNVQFWYWLVWPTMIVAIPEVRSRRAFFLLYPFLDITSIICVFTSYRINAIAADFYQGYTTLHPIIPLIPH